MALLNRKLKSKIKDELLHSNKVIIIFGARQVGKTTLIKQIISESNLSHTSVNGEEAEVGAVFNQLSYERMMELVGNSSILFVDEAQAIEHIGKAIKILHDKNPDLKIVLSGSSSFELANKLQEPLTGRKKVFTLYPFSCEELIDDHLSPFDLKQKLNSILRFGLYPEVYKATDLKTKQDILRELSSSYLYRDILMLTDIRHHNKLHDLLKLLALQIGSTVSINKLANALNLNTKTVEDYILKLEQSFVIFRLRGFSKNLAKEISKQDKIYFYDIGIRNAILNNFLDLTSRNDTGSIWENFLISERMKTNGYHAYHPNTYFWRTYTGAEIDYIEELNNEIKAYEFKFSSKTVSAPKSWTETYPSSFETVNTDNFLSFIQPGY
jgi:uncharacterized protein